MRVLIVEDDLALSDVVSFTLRSAQNILKDMSHKHLQLKEEHGSCPLGHEPWK